MDKKPEESKPEHHETLIERIEDELESRFIAAAEVATRTTSAETNLASAALRAIEGPPKSEPSTDPTQSPDPGRDAGTQAKPAKPA